MHLSQILLIVITTVAATLASPLPPVKAEFVCPEAIWPCFCSTLDGGHVECYLGDLITQQLLDEKFMLVRQANNLTSHDWLELDTVVVEYSNLTELNLTFLQRVKMSELYIRYNMELTTLLFPPLNESAGLFDIAYIAMNNNALTDAGVGDTLKYFKGSSVLELDLARNSILGAVETGEEFQEFLPGLSAFTNLEKLRLEENYIQKLRPGQFKSNNRLRDLSLYWNQIVEISENAFIFDETPADMVNQSLWVDLHMNRRLSDTTLHPNNGLDLLDRKATFYLDYTNLRTLPQTTFEKFLDAHPENLLKVWTTPLVCDDRMKWLKDRKDEFQNFVQNANCSNDPGFDVFTTTLISLALS